MRKLTVFFLSLLMIVFHFSSLLYAEALSPVNVIIDGVVQNYNTSPVIQNDSVLVPMRPVFERLGAEVAWDEATRTVRATRGDQDIQITIGSLEAVKNGESIRLLVEPTIMNGNS